MAWPSWQQGAKRGRAAFGAARIERGRLARGSSAQCAEVFGVVQRIAMFETRRATGGVGARAAFWLHRQRRRAAVGEQPSWQQPTRLNWSSSARGLPLKMEANGLSKQGASPDAQ